MGRTATTGEFKDGSFKIKLIISDKVSKYSVFFTIKNLNQENLHSILVGKPIVFLKSQ